MRSLLLVVPLTLAACGGSATGTPTVDAGDAGMDSSHADGPSEGGTCRPDVQHRPTADPCPSHADAGVIDAGTCGQPLVPRDECLADGDCSGSHGAIGVCACQAPQGEGCGVPPVTGNVCVPANCHVDSDCSPCARCRIEQSCGVVTGYYCESPADECSSNADCGTGFCNFTGANFACQNDVACAG